MFVTLNRGGQLVLADNALHLAELPAAREVTLIYTVPSAMTELLRMRAVPDSVRVVNLAGEPLTEELVADIYANTNAERVYNRYGPSEHTTYSTYTLCKDGEHVTIGRPVANTRAHVLDEQLQPVPVGVIGDLYINGAGLARDQEGEEKRLVAYVVAEASARVSELRAWLRERLPEFMTPAAFVMMDALPLTPNGKVDRKALPAPDFSVAEESLTAPRTQIEEVLLGIWANSTGRSKGVAVSHGALLNLVSWHNSVFNISASDRATLLAGVSFDASVWELWPYMSRGASLDLPPDDLRSSPEGLRDWITQRAVTVSFVPAPVAEPMLALEWSSETKLRTLLTGGDRLHTWPTSALPFAVVNNNGPTENAVVSTSGLVSREGGAPGTAPNSADRSAMSVFTSWTSAANPCRSASSESFGSVGIAWREAISIGLSSPLKCLCPTR